MIVIPKYISLKADRGNGEKKQQEADAEFLNRDHIIFLDVQAWVEGSLNRSGR